MESLPSIDKKGSCHCGSVEFRVRGNILLNVLCHCKTCSQNRGMSPVHIINITPAEGVEITKGEELLTLYRGNRKVDFCFCEKCGCCVYQAPEGYSFRGIFPTNFHIEDGINCTLPEEYLPKFHVNYENRLTDWHDPLPKYKTFPLIPGLTEGPEIGILMTNAGEAIHQLLDSKNLINTRTILNAS